MFGGRAGDFASRRGGECGPAETPGCEEAPRGLIRQAERHARSIKGAPGEAQGIPRAAAPATPCDSRPTTLGEEQTKSLFFPRESNLSVWV
ncbi:Hypothetical predicted protein [Cloeon dipterum]|uniref:Uncharacterized protein n=1 Tax=Cloeon dipterum TaxID=197152 RepID=A0A8S1E3W1_9INSE|nr:Hypothetical predicted protein [Cloeon dipterum]